MIDDSGDVMKTFTDYSDEVPIQFIKFTLDGKHGWVGKNLTVLSSTGYNSGSYYKR